MLTKDREFFFIGFSQVWSGLCDCTGFTTETECEVTSLRETSAIRLTGKPKGKNRFLTEGLLNFFAHFTKPDFPESSASILVLCCSGWMLSSWTLGPALEIGDTGREHVAKSPL